MNFPRVIIHGVMNNPKTVRRRHESIPFPGREKRFLFHWIYAVEYGYICLVTIKRPDPMQPLPNILADEISSIETLDARALHPEIRSVCN